MLAVRRGGVSTWKSGQERAEALQTPPSQVNSNQSRSSSCRGLAETWTSQQQVRLGKQPFTSTDLKNKQRNKNCPEGRQVRGYLLHSTSRERSAPNAAHLLTVPQAASAQTNGPGLVLQVQSFKALGLEIFKYCSFFNAKQWLLYVVLDKFMTVSVK